MTHDSSWTSRLRRDLPASLVVFLVALPLCMGIAIACGAPVASGLITGIVGGIVVGMLAGSPLQVSGPAAGLTVVVFEVIRDHGLPALGLVVMIAGAIQLVAGIFRLGQWFRAVSPAVIEGMLAGIGVLILVSQLHVMVDDKPRADGLENIATLPEAFRKGLPLPAPSTAEDRRQDAQFLRQIGRLHEKQEEIEELVAETVSIHATPQEHQSEARQLSAYIDRQLELSGEWEAMRSAIELAYRERNTERSQRLQAVAQQASQAQQAALEALRGQKLETAEAVQREAVAALTAVRTQLKNHEWAAKVGLATILILIAWQTLAPRRLRMLPAPLIAVSVVTLLTATLNLPVLYVEVPDRLSDGIHFPAWTVLDDVPLTALVQAALVIALVASAETLLCASAVDQMHTGPRTRYDRELSAQGIGNMICGMLGALPMTGVIVRSAANVQAGGVSRMSAILHGVWLLIFVVGFGALLRMIPTASLAAVLVYTGYKLVNLKAIGELRRYGWGEVAVYLVTMATIVVADLLTGVLVGLALAAARLLYTFSHLSVRLERNLRARRASLRLDGAATFLRLPQLAESLEHIPAGYEVHVSLHDLHFIDSACLELLNNWAEQHEATGGRVLIDWDHVHRVTKRPANPNRNRRQNAKRAAEKAMSAASPADATDTQD